MTTELSKGFIEWDGLLYGPNLPQWYINEFERHAPFCKECGVVIMIPYGETRVYHRNRCEFGRVREERREKLRNQLARLRSDYDHEEGTWTMVDKRIKGHEEIVIATGYHNPKDREDWCYLIQCKCGAKDIAWNHEDARQAARDHRVDVRTPAPTRPAKAPRAARPVPSTTKPARRRTAQPEPKPRRVLY